LIPAGLRFNAQMEEKGGDPSICAPEKYNPTYNPKYTLQTMSL
jgi:hypothetical protein